MLFSGRLSRDKRAQGSIIGAAFLVMILLSGYTFYTLVVSVANDYTETLQDMQQLDSRKYKENIEFVSVSFNQDKLNITVRNTGPYLSHLIWLGIFDRSQLGNRRSAFACLDFGRMSQMDVSDGSFCRLEGHDSGAPV